MINSQSRFLFVPVRNSAAVEIVRRQFNEHAIAGQNSDEVLAHLAGDVRQHLVLVIFQLHSEHGVGQGLEHLGHYFYRFFLRHILSV